MGTRADFYVGWGKQAEWLGSVAYDGYQSGVSRALLDAKTKASFLAAFAEFAASREDFTAPVQGWPWPWEDSCTTDYAYSFDVDKVRVFCFGREVLPGDTPEDHDSRPKTDDFPNMKDRQNVAFGERSGLLILRFST